MTHRHAPSPLIFKGETGKVGGEKTCLRAKPVESDFGPCWTEKLPGQGWGVWASRLCSPGKQGKSPSQQVLPGSGAPQDCVGEVTAGQGGGWRGVEGDNIGTGTAPSFAGSSWGGSHSDWQPTTSSKPPDTPTPTLTSHEGLYPPRGVFVHRASSHWIS